MEAMILAGGLGTRLSSRLTDRPKAMAPVSGKPFLAYLLDKLLESGCHRVLLSVGHLRQVISDDFGESYCGMALHYVVEETPSGTGGAIRQALSHAAEDSLLVLNGDTYLDADYAEIFLCHRISARPMTMAVVQVENTERYGGVLIDEGRVAGFVEKGRAGAGWINAGAYILHRDFPWPEALGQRFSFEADVLMAYLDQLRPAAFVCQGYFLDIGIPEDLDRAQLELPSALKPRPETLQGT